MYRPQYVLDTEVGDALVTVKVEVEWFDKINNKPIFKKQFTGYSEYDPTGATDRDRETALEESISQITEDIINSILSGW